MRILLINPPSNNDAHLFTLADYDAKARTSQPPLGLMYLKSHMNPHHEVKIIDMAVNPNISLEIEIRTFEPDVIGITVVIGKWTAVMDIAKEIKRYTNVPLVAGGINPSIYPFETLTCQSVDYVVTGYGQKPFLTLCNWIEKDPNTIYNNINNVYTRYNCTEKIAGKFEFDNIDYYKYPDRQSLDINYYTMPYVSEGPVTSMISSTGCPYNCNYCASRNLKPVRLRDKYSIVNEMRLCQSLGIKGIIFQDELFAMSTKRITEICSLITKHNIELKWSVRSRANLVNLEALKLMKEAGCVNVHLGIESGTNRILTEMNKKLTVNIIQKSVDTIKEAGLRVSGSFMLGYKDENHDEIVDSIDFAKKLNLDSTQFYTTQPEPCTILYEQLKQSKKLPDDIYSEFTLHPESIDLTQNIASTNFSKTQMDDFLRYAYSQVRSLYDIKKESEK